MKHTVTIYNEFLGESTLSFDSRAKTEKGLIDAAKGRIAMEMGGCSSVMTDLTHMLAIDGHPVVTMERKPRVTRDELCKRLRRRRSYVRDSIGYIAEEIMHLQGQLMMLDAEEHNLSDELEEFENDNE